jgi:hypothetical protein
MPADVTAADRAFREMLICVHTNAKKLSTDTQDGADAIARAVDQACGLETAATEGAQSKEERSAEQGPVERDKRGESLHRFVENEARGLIVQRRAAHCVLSNNSN